MSLTKADMAVKVAQELEIHQLLAKDLVSAFFEEIKQQLEQTGEVKISGFGNFELKEKASRPGRNPKTGKTVMIEKRKVVKFKPGQKLKMIVS